MNLFNKTPHPSIHPSPTQVSVSRLAAARCRPDLAPDSGGALGNTKHKSESKEPVVRTRPGRGLANLANSHPQPGLTNCIHPPLSGLAIPGMRCGIVEKPIITFLSFYNSHFKRIKCLNSRVKKELLLESQLVCLKWCRTTKCGSWCVIVLSCQFLPTGKQRICVMINWFNDDVVEGTWSTWALCRIIAASDWLTGHHPWPLIGPHPPWQCRVDTIIPPKHNPWFLFRSWAVLEQASSSPLIGPRPVTAHPHWLSWCWHDCMTPPQRLLHITQQNHQFIARWKHEYAVSCSCQWMNSLKDILSNSDDDILPKKWI